MKRPTKLEGHVDRLLKPHAHVTEARQRKRETVNLNAMQLAFLAASAESKVERGQAKFVEDKPTNGIPVVRAISCTDGEALRVKQLTIRVKALVRIRGRGLHPDVIEKAVKLATPRFILDHHRKLGRRTAHDVAEDAIREAFKYFGKKE